MDNLCDGLCGQVDDEWSGEIHGESISDVDDAENEQGVDVFCVEVCCNVVGDINAEVSERCSQVDGMNDGNSASATDSVNHG